MSELTSKRIVIGVCGGIACYKVCTLVSRLVQRGADVTVLMTEAATRFVTPLTFETLSGKPVFTSLWEAIDNHESQHIAVAKQCDAMVIAPATANTLAKLANGLCDNVVTTITCAVPRQTPVVIAPAMNAEMWDHPITQENIRKLKEIAAYRFVGPEEGWQACRTQGQGRMSEPEVIVDHVVTLLSR